MKRLMILLFPILISVNSYSDILQEFHNNGQIKFEIEWYENGKMKSEIHYDYFGEKRTQMHFNKSGEWDGLVSIWIDDILVYDAVYKDGKCISAKSTSRTVKNNNCNIYIDGGPYKVDKLIN
jgi:hypothetical protein